MGTDRLAAEAIAFSRYLVGADPDGALIERYAAACTALFPGEPSADDEALLGFVLRSPRTIAALDSACALIRPGSLLRRKILMMAAIIETTPRGAALFLPSARSAIGLSLVFLRGAVTSAVHLGAGVVLLYLAQRRGGRP